MSTTRTGKSVHMGITLDYLISLPDDMLERADKANHTAAELRAHFEELKQQGYTILPCSCGNYDETGACTGA